MYVGDRRLELFSDRGRFLDDEAYLRLRQELPDYLKPMLVVGYGSTCPECR